MRISDCSSDLCSSDLCSPASSCIWSPVRICILIRCGSTQRFSRVCAICIPRLVSRWRVASSRSEEHTSELQSLMRISYAVFCLKKKKTKVDTVINTQQSKQSSNRQHTNTRMTKMTIRSSEQHTVN